MVKLLNVKNNDTVYDPFCGVGGFFNEVLNPLFDSLIVDYPGFINVNENYFSDINLSSIDMHVFYKQQSHSLVVPLFPITTTKRELEYLN